MPGKERSKCGRALFYTRDSGGRHECTLGQYVEWAAKEASKRGLTFIGTGPQIDGMAREDRYHEGDLFLDYVVAGNTLSRRALDALIEEVGAHLDVSHIEIYC